MCQKGNCQNISKYVNLIKHLYKCQKIRHHELCENVTVLIVCEILLQDFLF
jgi:hypothetical protein